MTSAQPATGGLLAVHAHPDDETLATGGLLAAWAADGRPVTLVTCTRGEQGEVIPPELAHLEGDGPALAAHRERELAAATARLGVQDASFLDTVVLPGHGAAVYRDSGMAWAEVGRAARRDELPPDAFVAAPIDDAAARLARVLRDRRPDVVVTYEPGGGYGHPDHVRAHAVTMRAVHLAASGDAAGLGDLPVHAVPVVLWAAVADDVLRGAYAALPVLTAAEQARAQQPTPALPDPAGPLPSVAVAAADVDLAVDVRAVLFRLVTAMGEHRTQVRSAALGTPVPLADGVALVGCYALSNHVLAPLLDREFYRFAPGSDAAGVVWPAVVTPVR